MPYKPMGNDTVNEKCVKAFVKKPKKQFLDHKIP